MMSVARHSNKNSSNLFHHIKYKENEVFEYLFKYSSWVFDKSTTNTQGIEVCTSPGLA